MWDKSAINNHIIACELLNKVKDSSFNYIKNNPNTTEYEVQEFILKELKKIN